MLFTQTLSKTSFENDPGMSFKIEVNRHAECGYSVFTKFAHGVAKNRLKFYVDRDSMEKFDWFDWWPY